MSQVTIDISPTGADVIIDVDGVIGSSCKDITSRLGGRLGTITGDNDKPELYECTGVEANAC